MSNGHMVHSIEHLLLRQMLTRVGRRAMQPVWVAALLFHAIKWYTLFWYFSLCGIRNCSNLKAFNVLNSPCTFPTDVPSCRSHNVFAFNAPLNNMSAVLVVQRTQNHIPIHQIITFEYVTTADSNQRRKNPKKTEKPIFDVFVFSSENILRVVVSLSACRKNVVETIRFENRIAYLRAVYADRGRWLLEAVTSYAETGETRHSVLLISCFSR